jgi:hypothetical protein
MKFLLGTQVVSHVAYTRVAGGAAPGMIDPTPRGRVSTVGGAGDMVRLFRSTGARI